MKRGARTLSGLSIHGIAVWLAAAVALAPQRANSGAFETDTPPPVPRFSNEHHLRGGIPVGPDCLALPPGAAAAYVPGRDAFGRPVIPAEPPRRYDNGFPAAIELDVHVGGKHRRKGDDPHITVPLTYDLGARGLNGRPAPWDCTHSFK